MLKNRIQGELDVQLIPNEDRKTILISHDQWDSNYCKVSRDQFGKRMRTLIDFSKNKDTVKIQYYKFQKNNCGIETSEYSKYMFYCAKTGLYKVGEDFWSIGNWYT